MSDGARDRAVGKYCRSAGQEAAGGQAVAVTLADADAMVVSGLAAALNVSPAVVVQGMVRCAMSLPPAAIVAGIESLGQEGATGA